MKCVNCKKFPCLDGKRIVDNPPANGDHNIKVMWRTDTSGQRSDQGFPCSPGEHGVLKYFNAYHVSSLNLDNKMLLKPKPTKQVSILWGEDIQQSFYANFYSTAVIYLC